MSAIVSQFEYHKPASFNDALALLDRLQGVKILAGGTDLVCQLKEDIIAPAHVVDIKGIKNADCISLAGSTAELQALVTFTQLISSPLMQEHFPLLVESSMTVASGAVRNRATMVGNICSAVPCMDSAAGLLVYEAEVIVQSHEETRVIPIEKWFLKPRVTSIRANEMVTSIRIKPCGLHGGVYLKLGRYTGEDLAQANVGILALPEQQYRISFGSLSAVPIRARKIEALLNGQSLTPELVTQAKDLVASEIAPITDIRATKEYRLHMAKVMLERGLSAAVARLHGTGPALGDKLI